MDVARSGLWGSPAISGRRSRNERLARPWPSAAVALVASVVVEDTAEPISDVVDLIVDFAPRHSGLDLVALAEEPEQIT